MFAASQPPCVKDTPILIRTGPIAHRLKACATGLLRCVTRFIVSFLRLFTQSRRLEIDQILGRKGGSVRQLVRQAAEMHEEANRSEDPKFRQLMMEVADGCEESARNLAAGLLGMRQGIN